MTALRAKIKGRATQAARAAIQQRTQTEVNAAVSDGNLEGLNVNTTATVEAPVVTQGKSKVDDSLK